MRTGIWATALVVAGMVGVLLMAPLAAAHAFRGDLTAPAGGNPFGSDTVGSYRIVVHGTRVVIRADVDLSPPAGYVLEGWLVDMQTGYKLSLGELRHGHLRFEQHMVNPWTYGILVITAEPAGDLDPNPAMPVAGALLPAPFGQ